MKFHGAAALGARVFFAPHLQDNIGVLDATTSTFSTITPAAGRVLNPETGGMSSSVSWFGRKYAGATVLGTNVYFTPYARCARHRTLDLTSSGASVLSRACGPIATAQDADAVGVLRTSEPPPAATNASCAVVLPADQNDPSRLPPSAPAHAALPSQHTESPTISQPPSRSSTPACGWASQFELLKPRLKLTGGTLGAAKIVATMVSMGSRRQPAPRGRPPLQAYSSRLEEVEASAP